MIRRTVSFLIIILFSAALLSGCAKDVFSDTDPAAPYDEEEIYEPPYGGKFALRQKDYRFVGKQVSLVSVENLSEEPYDVQLIIRYRNAEGKTVGVMVENIGGLSSGAKKYCVHQSEKEWETKDVKFISYPAEKQGYYDKLEFGSNIDLYAYAMADFQKGHSYDTAYSDPVLAYSYDYDIKNSSGVELYAQGTLVVLDKNGEIFDIVPFASDYAPTEYTNTLTRVKFDMPWDESYVMPEELREGVTGIFCLDYLDPENPYNIAGITSSGG